MYHNYKFFKELVNSSPFDVSQIFDAIYGLEVVGILLDKENPQEIFESLNSTGLDLSNNDLIRNYLLMPLTDTDYQEELYKKYWLQLEKLINPDNMELFITHYLITKRRSDLIKIKIKLKIFLKICSAMQIFISIFYLMKILFFRNCLSSIKSFMN